MKNYKHLSTIVLLYAVFAVMSNVGAGKIVSIGIFTVSATVVFFPFTYIFADILTEVYGYSQARNVAWKMLGVYFLAAIMAQAIVWLPAAPGFAQSEAFAVVLGNVPRIIFGSLVAVWVGSIVNDYVMAKMKVWTKGKFLWARIIGSTVASEGINTLLFYGIALYAIIPADLFWKAILSGWILKSLIEIVMTPVTYKVCSTLKKVEQVDYYDEDTNFNPFIFKA